MQFTQEENKTIS